MPGRKATQEQRVHQARKVIRDLRGLLGKLALSGPPALQVARVRLELGALQDQLALPALQDSPARRASPVRKGRRESKG